MPTAPPGGRLDDVHADVVGLHNDHTVVESAQIKTLLQTVPLKRA